MILAGDIGGTKTNVALFTFEDRYIVKKQQYQFASYEFESLKDILRVFRKKVDLSLVKSACFGLAGPVIEGHCLATNLPWKIDISDLETELNIQKVYLLNDLEATAYGMIHLPEDQFVHLNPEGHAIEGNRAVIAAGTGLGEAMLYYDGRQYHPLASEGGHSDFAPVTPQQEKLLKWLRYRYPEHVNYERILSGEGISTLYKFLLESGFAPEAVSLKQEIGRKDHAVRVSECALKEKDPLCMETLRLFVEIYGAEAGNLALKSLARGGVYIGGGIAPKILEMMREKYFMKSFIRKGRFEGLLKDIQVKVSLNTETALLGAAHYAADKLK